MLEEQQEEDHHQPSTHQNEDEESADAAGCVIPCGHIYDPVCAMHLEDDASSGGGPAGEVREFANECTMRRMNCEWNKSKSEPVDNGDILLDGFSSILDFRVVAAEHCETHNEQEMTAMPSRASAAAMRMHLPWTET